MQTLLRTSFNVLSAVSLVMFQMMKGSEWQDEIVFQRHKKNVLFFFCLRLALTTMRSLHL